MGAMTQESLEEWQDLIQDVSYKWGELMETHWVDLPPDTSRKILKASNAFADVGDSIAEHLGTRNTHEE